jgi:hypothetical protein
VIEKAQGNCMADTKIGGVLAPSAASYLRCRKEITMVDILLMAQWVRSPIEAIARRWYCRSLFRATRGQRGCPQTTA